MRRGLLALLLAVSCGPARFVAPPEVPEAPDGLRAPKPVVFSPADDLMPSASSSGRYLAYASEQNGNLDVWVRDWGTNSSYPITLDSAEDFDPAVSPDGERVAFVSRRDDAKGDVFITSIQSAGSGLERLTDQSTADRQPAFSSDGRKVFYTSAVGIGLEFISAVDVESKESRRVSPTPGFDPSPSPDGRYLVYTAPGGTGGRRWPHLVALRLADSATRAITADDGPEGFARFWKESPKAHVLVYVRFPDDDNQDGVLDRDDSASLWRLDLDLDGLFAAARSAAGPALPEPFPLTDGSTDDLFPDPSGGFVYFTQGDRQQDILRLPITGTFPPYEDPAKYLALGDAIDEPRTKWFAYRSALARGPRGGSVRAQALLRIGNLQLSRGRPDLARLAFEVLVGELRGSSAKEAPDLSGLAEAELVSIQRRAGLAAAPRPLDRERVLRTTLAALDDLSARYASSPLVTARIDLEEAEVLVDRGDRARAIDAFAAVVKRHHEQPSSAARAMLREIELLGVAHDPDALGEAYSHVLDQFPDERDAVRASSERIVAVQLEGLAAGASWQTKVDALSRLVPRFDRPGKPSPVRLAARWAIVRILREIGALADVVPQLERLIEESTSDRLGAAKALSQLAEVNEAEGRLDAALESWQKLRAGYRDLPGVDADARDAITRVGTKKAALEEEQGHREAARAVYKSIIDNDLTQVKAHRRYLALSAETGKLSEALEEARIRAERSPRTPMARYAYGLALTWEEPPRLDEAQKEIEAALELNPQFTHAYLTRGWILEMKELVKPGFFASIWRGFVKTANAAIGGIFSVKIAEPDFLLLAIDDYTRALQLNRESEDPDTEVEIMLNDANASYRLGDKTNDLGNMKKAFSRYVECLRSGYHFQSPITELVFYERLGRSATWVEEWAVSAMATRRAIDLAEQLGQTARLSQLYGNLSLAYGQAGEGAYANQALALSESALEAQKVRAKLLIAKRNRALSKLDQPPSSALLDGALDDLYEARRLLDGIDEGHGDVPDWVATTEDASSAQYGFGRTAERNLNVALATRAHREGGDLSRARALEGARRRLAHQVGEVIEKRLWVMPTEPTTLLMLRDRLGLDVAAALEEEAKLGRDGAPPAAGQMAADAILDAASAELDRSIASPDLKADEPSLRLDRARVAAVATELYAARRSDDVTREASLDAALARGLEDVDQALIPPGTKTSTLAPPKDTDAIVAALPAVLSSTGALAQTASIALQPPGLEAIPLEARAVHARLLHARGLLTMKRASRVGQAKDLRGVLAELDASDGLLREARAAFEDAARHAATAGPARGAMLAALSLGASAMLSRTLHDRRDELVRATRDEAVLLARALGREDLALSFALDGRLADGAFDEARALLTRALPQDLAGERGRAAEVLARSASVAIGKKDILGALELADRWMLLETAARPFGGTDGLQDRSDRTFAEAYRGAWSDLERAETALRQLENGVTREVVAVRRAAIARARKGLEALRTDGLSDAARARAFAEPLRAKAIADVLEPKEALLGLLPIDGQVHLVLVEGSTTAASASEKMRHAVSPLPLDRFLERSKEVRAALEANASPPKDALLELERALTSSFGDRLRNARRLVVADLLTGGPIPDLALRGHVAAIVHVSSPTAFALARGQQLVGVEGEVAIATSGPPSMAPALSSVSTRLGPEQAMAFRRLDRPAEAVPHDVGKGRRLDDRPAAELLQARASRLVVVEAPLFIEPEIPERSLISFAPSGRDEDEDARLLRLAREVDRFREELPIEDLAAPAASLVLARVSPSPVGHPSERLRPGDPLRLDLPLAMRGFATTLLVPEAVPAEAARRVIDAYAANAAEKGPALALAEAVREEAKTAPSVELIVLVGSPGLDRAGSKALAQRLAPSTQKVGVSLFNAGKFVEASAAFRRLIRLFREAGLEDKLAAPYTILTSILAEKQPVADPARAADVQGELVRLLEAKPSSPANDRAVANAKVDLGRLYGAAGDHEAAERTLEAAITRLEERKDRSGAARGWFTLGRHYERDRLDFKKAAELTERAIAIYQDIGAFAPGAPADETARSAVKALGNIYLNRLSDPRGAKKAFERALAYARTDDERSDTLMALSRVARRSGDFQEAAEQAERVRALAQKLQRADLEADALIEAANIAWFQSDYRRGQDLCASSLEKVQKLDEKKRKRRKIYALSACGLIAMSRGEFSLAKDHLERARKIAEDLPRGQRESEVATQWNNLGRVYLEFGKLDEAVDAFKRALAIDEGLNDRFALAYDYRNLGTALAYQKDPKEAEQNLSKGLEFAGEVQDTNNELRARFALAELARDRGEHAAAKKLYEEALPLAESLDVRELTWQIHRALGLLALAEGALEPAEKELRRAVAIARSLTGRATGEFGPRRYAAFDDLVGLLLETNRTSEAFQVADLARSLEQTEILDDSRLTFASPDVPRLLGQARAAKTATTAAAAIDALAKIEPRLADLLRPTTEDELVRQIPEDGAVVMYRAAEEEIIAFVVDRAGVHARRTAASARELGAEIAEYRRRLAARSDLSSASAHLGELLVDPIRDLVATKKRLAIVPHRWLRYVALPALPFVRGGQELLVDRFVLVDALDPRGAALALASPLGPVGELPIVALGAPSSPPPGFDAPLVFAKKEVEGIREEYPKASVLLGAEVNKAKLLGVFAEARGVFHFAGHSRLGAKKEEGYIDPLGGELAVSDGPVSLLDVLGRTTDARLVVLSSCSSAAAGDEASSAGATGDEVLSLAEAFQIAGARNVLATTSRVGDVAAAMVMKRFYRAGRRLDAPAALREAELAVRALYPHPAWWGTFVLHAR